METADVSKRAGDRVFAVVGMGDLSVRGECRSEQRGRVGRLCFFCFFFVSFAVDQLGTGGGGASSSTEKLL